MFGVMPRKASHLGALCAVLCFGGFCVLLGGWVILPGMAGWHAAGITLQLALLLVLAGLTACTWFFWRRRRRLEMRELLASLDSPQSLVAEQLAGKRTLDATVARTVANLRERIDDQAREMQELMRLLAQRDVRDMAFIDVLSEGVIMLDSERRIVAENQAVEEIFGLQRNQILGAGMHVFLNEASQEQFNTWHDQLQQSGAAFNDRSGLVGKHADGSDIPLSTSATFLREGANAVTLVVIADLRPQLALESELSESRAFFRSLVENLPVAVFALQAQDYRYVLWNKAAEALTGAPASVIVGKELFEASDGEAQRTYKADLEQLQARASTAIVRNQTVISRSDEEVYVRTKTVPVLDEKQRITHFLSVSEDLTGEIEQQNLLHLQNQRLQHYLRTAGSCVVEVDDQGVIQVINQKLRNLLGKSEDEIVGKLYLDVFPGNFIDESVTWDTLKPVFTGDVDEVKMNTLLNGRYLSWNISRLEDPGDVRVIGVADDVTELVEEKNKAEAANAAKSQFLANMSHELRTPLNAIIGYSELLHEIALEEERASDVDDLERICGAGKHLLNLINQILDLAKAESGFATVERHTFSVESMLTEVSDLVRPLVEERDNAWRCSGTVNSPLCSDELKIRQVLINLISNAAKFTREGKVDLQYDVSAEQARFQVSDNGIGIEEEALAKIFDPFTQADESTARVHGGTGLGLSICRRFAEQLGGSLTVRSTLGEGSTFVLSLPNEYRGTQSDGTDSQSAMAFL